MQKDLLTNLKYPKSARKSKVEGTVYLKFIINKKGEVKDCTILRGVRADVDAAALEGVSMLRNWVPGMFANHNINFQYVIPIRFNLKGWWFW